MLTKNRLSDLNFSKQKKDRITIYENKKFQQNVQIFKKFYKVKN